MVALLPSRSASIPRATPLTRTTTSLLLTLALISAVSAQTATGSLPARWGQASALVGSLFLVQGGKTQGTTGGGYTYDSAPSDGQMYALDLSSGFPLSSPPWQAVSVEADQIAPPAVSFHTMSPLNSTSLLLFGGDASPMLPIQTRNDSAYLLHLGPSASNRTVNYQTVPTTWNQPMRRLYHTSETNGRGQIVILGGQKADGSQIPLDEQWSIDTSATSPTFQLVSPSPPGSLVGSTSTMLSDGTLLLLGGLNLSGQLQSMQNLYAYSTRSRTWSQTTTTASSSNQTLPARQTSGTSAAFPARRRNHIAVSLPNQRLFIHGGANADLSAVYSDAWILDWSVNPPVWSQLESTGGPGARYSHSAVAYGRQVVISFGWSGANAASTALYVFDASTLLASTSSQGSWSGGSWSSTTYTPDPQVTRPSTPASSSASSSAFSSNGSSSSSGGSSTPSSDSNNSPNSNGSDTSSGSFPTNPGTSGNHGSAHADGASDGAKAGAAIGALLGAGLIVGAGYAAYRRRSLNNYRRYADASVGLLGLGEGRGAGPDDDDYLMEKGEYHPPYHRTEDGGAPLTGGVGYGRKPGRSEGTAWTAANVGHAMEGSGPHFRQRIAILAGRGKRDTHVAPRVDMLADEGDGNSLFRPQHPQEPSHLYNDQDEQDLDSPCWNVHQLREHSYAQVGEEDLSLGDLGRLPHHDDDREAMAEHDLCSPFEDRPEESPTQGIALISGLAHEDGKLADRKVDRYERHSDDDGRSDFDFGPSIQSHDTASKSDVPSSSKSYDVLATGGMVSFSDASHGRKSAQGSMKRSPTWWDRFMGNSLLERTASGRFLTGPNANVPIRDPAPPPVSGLEAITESPRSRDVSEANRNQAQDPFADSDQLHMDQMGRRLPTQGEELYPSHSQGRSLSSIGSARTNASSHFELRLRGMDVIQRVPTTSSRRTQSTTRTGSTMSDSDSEQALSRGPTLLRPKNVASSEALGEEDTPASLVWRPEHFTHPQAGLEDLQEEQTEDLAQTSYPAVQSSSPPLSWSRAGQRKSNLSETPSITPLTTKRARLNRAMVSPLFPSAQPRLTAPAPTVAAPNASVRDKVKAFESQSSTTPENASIWTASLSSTKSRTFGTTNTETGDRSAEAMERAISPSSTATGSRRGGKKAKYYTHGLVPKAQLFVANPDGSDS
ncbi:hypothetical protein NDA14_007392 [Ustilago hordei]|nr:hypothetical protein NDA14_007392 [Ustilago hordei]